MLKLRSKRQDETEAPLVAPPTNVAEDRGPTLEDHALHLTGELCARCQGVIGESDEVRRTAKGGYAHLAC